MNVDSERRRMRRISREFSQAMKDISGMDVNEQNRGLNTFEDAMRDGRASFTLDKKGSSGTLRVLGQTTRINNRDEASLYKGIQDKAKSKRR